jgi:hypothetical protein
MIQEDNATTQQRLQSIFVSRQANLPNVLVWEILVDPNNNLLIATQDGIYQWDDTADAWQPLGLQGKEIRSLSMANDFLYAGLQNNGVWRAPLYDLRSETWFQENLGDGWDPTFTVRDLLYDTEFCAGLLAATIEGVWVLR